jgi:hypothetical protein
MGARRSKQRNILLQGQVQREGAVMTKKKIGLIVLCLVAASSVISAAGTCFVFGAVTLEQLLICEHGGKKCKLQVVPLVEGVAP